MSTIPAPIEDLILVDEAKLNEYPAWQRTIRRRQLEAGIRAEQAAKEAAANRAELLKKELLSLRGHLEAVGITIPEDAPTLPDESCIIWQGFHWELAAERLQGFEPRLRISLIVPGLTEAELDAQHPDWWDTEYKTAVSLVVNFRPTHIADALDELQAASERQRIINEALLEAWQQPATEEEPATAATTATATLQRYEQFALTPEGAARLQTLLTEGWTIAFEQFIPDGKGAAIHTARLEKQADAAPAPKHEEARASLSAFDAALIEILGDDDDEAAPIALDDDTPTEAPAIPALNVVYHVDERTISPALASLLEGKPIAQSIAQNGLEETRAALNAAIFARFTRPIVRPIALMEA